jgi:hypothetical protein
MAPRRRASGGVLRLFGLFVLLSAVALGSDRLRTIDLPCRLLADAESAEQGIEDVVVGHRTGDLA